MTRLYCAHTPDPNLREVCLCNNAFRCVLYPEAARAMRERERERDEIQSLVRTMLEAPRPRLRAALRIVEERLARERAAKEAP